MCISMLVFVWVLGIPTQVLTVAWEAFNPLSDLPPQISYVCMFVYCGGDFNNV